MAKRKARNPGKPTPRRGPSGNADSLKPNRRRAMQLVQQTVELLNRGDLRRAMVAVEQGLRLDPQNADLLHLGGQAALHAGDVQRGIELIRSAIKVAPKSALFHYNLASALVVTGDLDNALSHFRRAIRLNPSDADAYANMGILLARRKQPEEAELAFSEAARLQPGNPQFQLNLAICNGELREPQKAEAAVRKLEQLVSEPDADLLHQIGNIYRGLGRNDVARDYYERALKLKPKAPEILFPLGDVLSRSGDNRGSLEVMRGLQDVGYDPQFVKPAIASILANLGEIDAARELLTDVAECYADDMDSLLRVAKQYPLLGDFDQQEAILRRVLAMDPENVDAFQTLMSVGGRKLNAEDAEKLARFADDNKVDAETRTSIGFALGDHFRHAKYFDRSFHYYRLGNRLKGYSFDRANYLRWLEQVESELTPDFFAERREWGSDSRLPVLIVGMPRSGTTLTEQILSAHPAIHGAGEYGRVSTLSAAAPNFRRGLSFATSLDQEQVARHSAEYLAQMRKVNVEGAAFVTNKLPHNFEDLGLFALLFPNAPIVHIRREPRDNLLSIYFHNFVGTHEYAYDLKTLGTYYRLYERLMAHWKAVIPNPLYELEYEDLVADLPAKAHELAAFVGVEFDERMLRYYEHERVVETASNWQVRQPIYSSSVARWKPYEGHLKPMFDALALSDD